MRWCDPMERERERENEEREKQTERRSCGRDRGGREKERMCNRRSITDQEREREECEAENKTKEEKKNWYNIKNGNINEAHTGGKYTKQRSKCQRENQRSE